jgi:DNA polymerase-3 subunit delta
MSGVHVVRGADPTLRAQALHTLVDELLEGEDRSLAVEEFEATSGRGGDEADGDTSAVAAVLQAATSPPFMTARRIVVLRGYDNLGADDAKQLAAYVAAPMETTELVLEGEKASRTKALEDALGSGASVQTQSAKTADVIAEQLDAAGLELDGGARQLMTDHLGDDAGRVVAIVELLASTYGPGAQLRADDVEPYLGEAGSVRSYELTNRIEAGDVAGALDVLHRLLTAPEPGQRVPMHPLQVMGLLHSRYRKLLRLDDPEIRTVDDAHAALGGRKGSTFGSKKALEATRTLGTDGLRRAFDHLHAADVSLKGATGMPEDAVMAVLVARLAALGNRRGSRARAGR